MAGHFYHAPMHSAASPAMSRRPGRVPDEDLVLFLDWPNLATTPVTKTKTFDARHEMSLESLESHAIVAPPRCAGEAFSHLPYQLPWLLVPKKRGMRARGGWHRASWSGTSSASVLRCLSRSSHKDVVPSSLGDETGAILDSEWKPLKNGLNPSLAGSGL